MKKQNRQVLLVGSLPFETEEMAMNHALETLGADLWSLPDGEIGEKSEQYPLGTRAAWVQSIIDICEKDTQNWTLVREATKTAAGFPAGYDKEPRLKPRHSPSEMHKHLNFRWVEYFKTSYPIFKKLRKERGLPGLKFQIGLPTGLGIAFPMLSPVNALRYAAAFNKRMAIEANQILQLADPNDLIFQIEVPGELAMAYRLPAFLVNFSINPILQLVSQIEPKVPFGVHICLGDLNNEALTQASTLGKMVNFSNHLVKKWPETHTLDYIHYPLAEGAVPPPLKESYYQALKNIQLPAHTRFVAGFIHDKRTEAEHQQILTMIEKVRGNKVDIACSCGLGRRTPNIAKDLIQMSHKLTTV